MGAFLEGLLSWVQAHPAWAGLAVFLVALAESFVAVGLILPGTVLMFGIGALVGSGALDFTETVLWAFAGGVAGAGLSFWLGYHFRDRMRHWWPFSRHPELLARGEAFFRRHGGKSVFIGRFVGPIRPIVPAVAGMLGMAPGRFLVVNVASALLWAPAYLLPGVIFGTSLALASQVAARLALFLLLLVGTLWGALWLALRLYRWGAPRAGRLLWAVLAWFARHPRLRPWARVLEDGGGRAAQGLALWAAVLVLALLGLAWLPTWGMAWTPGVERLLTALATPWGDRWMAVLALPATAPALVLVALLPLLWWWHRGARRTARLWGAGVALVLPVAWLEQHGQVPVSAALFGVTVEWGLLTAFVAPGAGERWRPFLYGGWAMLVGVVGLARLYLGLDGLAAAVSGLTAGLAWVALVGIAQRLRREYPAQPQLLALSLLLLPLAWPALPEAQRAPPPPPLVVADEAWWTRLWVTLPAFRMDLGGEAEQPFTVQWGGALATLEGQLAEHGWRRAPPLDGRRLLASFQADPPLAELPVYPQLHEGFPEALVLVREDGRGGRWVLRLWATGLRLRQRGPVWQGYVARQRLSQPLGFLAVPRTEPGFDEPRAVLHASLKGLQWRWARREMRPPPGIAWDGRVLLVREGPEDER